MRKIAELTDASLLGRQGWADAAPRYTVRAILKNDRGLYAVMYAGKFHLYSLPGGGIEDGETKTEALEREIMEETGCSCDEMEELGYVYENRAHCDYTQYSYYYIVTTKGAPQAASLTETGKENRTKLQWHTLERAMELIRQFQPRTSQQVFLQARDLAALDAYRNRADR